ncbi:MAG: MFS transporter [bacterium]|nr:MFS transporter [bacterium]
MSHFIDLFLSEFKQFFCKRNLVVLAAILAVLLCTGYKGASSLKKTWAEAEDFQKSEASAFSKIRSYDEYSNSGVGVFFVPGAAGAFFTHPPVMSGLTSRVNTISMLNIYNNSQGKSVFKGNSQLGLRFAGIFSVLGSLAALFLGYGVMRGREYLRAVAAGISPFTVFSAIASARVILLCLGALFLAGTTLGVTLLLHHIHLTGSDLTGLAGYMAVTLIMLLFFFFIAAIAGYIRSRFVGIAVLLAVWSLFIFVLPEALNSMIEEKAEKLSTVHLANTSKLKIINDFEDWVVENAGKFNRNELDKFRELVEHYWQNIFPKVEAVDVVLRNETAGLVAEYNAWSMLTPVTFYNLVSAEVGSRGYGNYVVFYDYNLEFRYHFVRFWIDRVYYNNPKELVSFIGAGGYSNLFRGRSRFPGNFRRGVLFSLGIVIILGVVCYILFKRSVYRLPEKKFIKKLQNSRSCIVLDRGIENSIWQTTGDNFNDLLYNLFSGRSSAVRKAGFTGEILADDVNIAAESSRKPFTYIPAPSTIPGNKKVRHLLTTMATLNKFPRPELEELLNRPVLKEIAGKPFRKLTNLEKVEALLALTYLKKSAVYLFYNTAAGFPASCVVRLKDRMDELRKQGALVLYLTATAAVPDDETPEEGGFRELNEWEYTVEAKRKRLNNGGK